MWISISLASYFQLCHIQVLPSPKIRRPSNRFFFFFSLICIYFIMSEFEHLFICLKPFEFYQPEVSTEWLWLLTSSNLASITEPSFYHP